MLNKKSIHNNYISAFPSEIKSYFLFIKWFVSDSIVRYKAVSFIFLVAGFLGVVFEIQIFFIIIYYAKHFSSGDVIKIAGYIFDPRSSILLLSVGSLLVVISLFLSTLCTYFYKKNILHIGRRYEEFCSQRVFYLLGKGENIFSAEEDDKEIYTYLNRLAKNDSRFCGRFLRELLSLVIPKFTFLAAVIVLFYLEPLLSIGIVVILTFFFYFQYKSSKQAAIYSTIHDKISHLSARGYKDLMQHFMQQLPGYPNLEFVAKAFSFGAIKKELDAYEGRLRAPYTSEFVSGIFIAIIIGLIILAMGASIIQEGKGWGRLFVYVLSLRYALINLRVIFSSITSANRFYPQARRHFHFVHSFQRSDRDECNLHDSYNIIITPASLPKLLKGSKSQLVLTVGTRLALVAKKKLNYYTLPSIMNLLIGDSVQEYKSALKSARIVIVDHSCPYQPLRRVLYLQAETIWADIRELFPDEQMWHDCKKQFSQNLDKQITTEMWNSLDKKYKFIISLIAAKNSNSQWVIIDGTALMLLDLKAVNHCLDLLRNKILVLLFNKNFEKVGIFGESQVVVSGRKKILGMGTPEWFLHIRKQVKEILSSDPGEAEITESQEEDM